MKTTKYFLALLTVVTAMACSKDDASEIPKQGTKPPTETPANKAPGAFELIAVRDGIYLKPKFAWNAAIDPEGESVTYDLYLDTQENPVTLLATDLTDPHFIAADSLHLVTEYHWKVVAKDAKGASVTSTVNTFTTRTLNFPDAPITDDAGFSERYGHSMVAFKDKLWIIGGYDGSSKNDVWTSSNGENWRKVSSVQVPVRDLFQPRSNHATVVFDDKLWVIGGDGAGGIRNDVWYSTDGVSWTEATPNAEFTPRSAHTSIVFQNKLWVIGGFDAGAEDFRNDVWSSADGITWTQETMDAGFSPRNYHSTVVFQDKLWVIGGADVSGFDMKDVWSSDDGVVWEEITSSAEFPTFREASAIVFDNKIMLFGIISEDSSNNIWYSTNGENWSAMTYTDNSLLYPKTALFKNKIWINPDRSKEIWALD